MTQKCSALCITQCVHTYSTMCTSSKLLQWSLFWCGFYTGSSFLHMLEKLESNEEDFYYKFSYYWAHDMQSAHEYYSVYLMFAYFGINVVYKQYISQVSATLLTWIICWKCIEHCIPKWQFSSFRDFLCKKSRNYFAIAHAFNYHNACLFQMQIH